MPIEINGRIFNKGDIVTFNQHAELICNAPAGLRVLIHKIHDDGLIGLYSPDKLISGWGDLDGEVPDNRGYWLPADSLGTIIREGIGSYEISSPFIYKGIELKGMSCRVLGTLQDGSVFVEFEEHVGGCSADGLGKSGHCVAVGSSILTARKQKKKSAK